MSLFAELIERRVEKLPDMPGCWLWTGGGVYGHLSAAGRTVAAHRLSYALANGDVPDGASVLHRCDVPACVRPSHLFLGTHAENMADMARKGRGSKAPGRPHRLSADDYSAIKASSEPTAVIAQRFGITTKHARCIRSGKVLGPDHHRFATHCRRGHPYTPWNVRPDTRPDRPNTRVCRACHALWASAHISRRRRNQRRSA